MTGAAATLVLALVLLVLTVLLLTVLTVVLPRSRRCGKRRC